MNSTLLPIQKPCKSQLKSSKRNPQNAKYKLNNQFSSIYQLEDQIGSGGYGFVMSAIHRVTRQVVAVKFIYKDKVPISNEIEPLEISILKQIKHPTVIDYIDSFQDDMYYYLVMELYGCEWKSSHASSSSSSSYPSPITPNSSYDETNDFNASMSIPTTIKQQKVRRSSCDLFECIESQTKLSESETHKIFKQIVQCVDDLSNVGIYHRDIKDENIVVDSDFKVNDYNKTKSRFYLFMFF